MRKAHSPSHSPIPFIHPPVKPKDIKFYWSDYDEEIPDHEKKNIRKKAGKLICVGCQVLHQLKKLTGV